MIPLLRVQNSLTEKIGITPEFDKRMESITEWLKDLVEYQTPLELLIKSGEVNWDMQKAYNAYITCFGNIKINVCNLIKGDYGIIDITYPAAGCVISLPPGSVVSNSGAGVLTLPASSKPSAIAAFYYNQNGILKWMITTNFS